MAGLGQDGSSRLLNREEHRAAVGAGLRFVHGLVGVSFAKGISEGARFRVIQRDECAGATSGIWDGTQGAGLAE